MWCARNSKCSWIRKLDASAKQNETKRQLQNSQAHYTCIDSSSSSLSSSSLASLDRKVKDEVNEMGQNKINKQKTFFLLRAAMHGTHSRHDKLQYVQVGRALTNFIENIALFDFFRQPNTRTRMHTFPFGLPVLFKICIFLSALTVNFMREFDSCEHVTLTRTVSAPVPAHAPPSSPSNALQMLWPEICHLQIHNKFTSNENRGECVRVSSTSPLTTIEWQTCWVGYAIQYASTRCIKWTPCNVSSIVCLFISHSFDGIGWCGGCGSVSLTRFNKIFPFAFCSR